MRTLVLTIIFGALGVWTTAIILHLCGGEKLFDQWYGFAVFTTSVIAGFGVYIIGFSIDNYLDQRKH